MNAGLLLHWTFAPILVVLAALAALAVWAASRHPRWPARRTASTCAGLGVAAVALG